MRIYVVRHGHKANQRPDYDGGANTPLSDRGENQAERVAEALADEGVDRVYSSAQLRALQTAAPVAAATSRDSDWHVWPLFCETSGESVREGDEEAWRAAWPTGERIDAPSAAELAAMDGNYYLLSDIPDRFPGTTLSQPFPWPEAWWEPLEETYLSGFARVALGAEALLDRHDTGDRVAVVCHNRSGSSLISAVMGFRREHRYPTPFDLGGITRMDLDADGVWRIKYANRTAHLGAEFESRFE